MLNWNGATLKSFVNWNDVLSSNWKNSLGQEDNKEDK